jgi:hypothetical protein
LHFGTTTFCGTAPRTAPFYPYVVHSEWLCRNPDASEHGYRETLIARDPTISVIVNDPVTHTYVVAYGRAEIVGLERYPELGNAIVEKYIPADQRQQFAAATQAIERASRVVIVLKPEKVVGRAWTAL